MNDDREPQQGARGDDGQDEREEQDYESPGVSDLKGDSSAASGPAVGGTTPG